MSVYTLLGIVVGLCLTVCYVVLEIARNRGEPDLRDAVELLLASLAGAGAVKLLVLAVGDHSITALDTEDRGYMALGSMCVVWVSVLAAIRVFRRLFASA